MTALARDNTMIATAKEGVAFLEKEGAGDLIALQGLDGVKNGNGDAKEADHDTSHNGTANGNGNGDSKMETDATPALPQHRTIVETTKEAEHVLAGETLAETRASTEQLKNAVATSSPPQKSRTMVETAKIGQALLGAEAPLIGETRKQTADTKKAEEETAKEVEGEKNGDHKEAVAEAEEKKEEAEAAVEEKPAAAAKKSPAKKSPAKEKASPAAKKAKKAEEPAAEAVEVVEAAPAKKVEEKKEASPKKRGGRSSGVNQLLEEAQKFAGNAAGDVKEGRTTRRSRGAEPAPVAAASPAKRGRQSKGKAKEADEDDE